MSTELRPLTTVELFDAAWLAIRRNWLTAYACAGAGTAPLALLLIGYFLWLGRLVKGTDDSVFYTGTAVWGGLMALAWAFNCVSRNAVAALIIGDVRNEQPTAASCWRLAWRHAWSGMFVGLVAFVAIPFAWSALAFFGIFLMVTWWVARPVVLVEDRPFLAALRRSWKLTEGYRMKAFGLWGMFLLMWLVAALNLHLLAHFLTGTVANLMGIDLGSLQVQLKWQNQAYSTFVMALVFVLLDPLKTAAEALLYLDLRVRREGADLAERLRSLRAGALTVLILAFALGISHPAAAMPQGDYAAKLKALRAAVERAKSADDVDPTKVGELRNQIIQTPDGQKLTVDNDWLKQGKTWESPADKARVLRRLDTLQRAIGPAVTSNKPGSAPGPNPVAQVDTKQELQKILAQPEFQPLAERTEFKDIGKSIDFSKSKGWWTSFLEWVRRTLFKPIEPKVQTPNVQPPPMAWTGWLAWVLGGAAVLFLIALLIRWFMERPSRGEAETAAVSSGEAPPLEASATENALDHTVDEWELFAQQWLDRGDVRQAVRALYLATLVHLHRERHIDYNRANTNWVYVRQFRGEAEKRSILQSLTGTFDIVWYGDRNCSSDQYQQFEQGVRTLGTPAPVAGGARA